MTKLELIELIFLIFIVVIAGVYYCIKAFKEHWIEKITDTAKAAIKEAEKMYPEGKGGEKKDYVLKAVKAKCEELKIPYDFIWKLISKMVDKIVDNYNLLAKK